MYCKEMNIDFEQLGNELITKGETLACKTVMDMEECHCDSIFQELIKQNNRAEQMISAGEKLISINSCSELSKCPGVRA